MLDRIYKLNINMFLLKCCNGFFPQDIIFMNFHKKLKLYIIVNSIWKREVLSSVYGFFKIAMC